LGEEGRLFFQNRVLRRIFGPKRDEVTGEEKQLHNEEVNDRYSSPNIVRVTRFRRMRLEGLYHVWERGQAYTGFRWRNLGERNHLGDPGVDGRIIIKQIFRKWDVGVQTGLIWLKIGTGGENL
jgi:hypothetical protein